MNDAQKFAHEIQSPLTSLEVQLRTLIEESPASTAALNCLLEVEALKSLVARFLELDMPVEPHDPWPLSTVLARIEKRFRPIAETRRVRLEIETAEAEARGDPLATERILANLVDNAIKFSREGGLVRVHVQHRDGHLHIEVSDDGRGIPSEARELIFEPFFRLDREAPGRRARACDLETARRGTEGPLATRCLAGRRSVLPSDVEVPVNPDRLP